MLTIFKYPIPLIGRPVGIEMPRGARILHVAAQGDKLYPFFWALVDTQESIVERFFVVVGTGRPCEGIVDRAASNYIGTAHCGPYVWHVCECR